MMVDYFLRLALLLPLLAVLIWLSLKVTRSMQSRLTGARGRARSVELLETSLIAPGMKLAVVRFHDREILLGCSRTGLVRLAEADGHRVVSEGDLQTEPRIAQQLTPQPSGADA